MRGVNKLVIEIKSDGEYFEKAILFLKPGIHSQHDITDNAEKLLEEISSKKKNPRISASPFLWAGLGAGGTWGIMFLFELLR